MNRTAGRQVASRVTVVGMTDEERQRAFRRARFHTMRVRVLRVVFPVLAVGLLGIYGLFLRQTITLETGSDGGAAEVSFRASSLSRDSLKMANPRYEGYAEDGSEYVVEAQSAVLGMKRTDPIQMDMITGTLTQADQTVTRLAARSGTYEQASGQMSLSGGIKIESSSGLAAQLQTAQIDPKQGIIVSDDTADVSMPTGRIVGSRLRIDQKQRLVTFADGVRATMKPPAQPGKAEGAPGSSSEASSDPVPAFGTASDEPLVVTAETLVVADAQSVATFHRNVRAAQGAAQLQAATLAIAYSRSADGSGQPGANSSGALPGQSSGSVQTITAEDNVILTRGADTIAAARAKFDVEQESGTFDGGVRIASGADRSASGQSVTFDQRRQSAVLRGNVRVQQGQNTLSGDQLEIDQAARVLVLSSPSEDGSSGRIAARFQPPKGQRSGTGREEQQRRVVRNPVAEGWSFRASPAAPVEIAANTLRVDDNAKTAVFKGRVNAAQGALRLSANVVTGSYTGSASVIDGGQSEAGQQLRSIRADGNVVVASGKDQRASGNWAVFDLAADTVTVGGNVELQQGRQTLRGDRLVIDLSTGLTRLTMQPTAATGSKPDGDSKRMRGTFYPTDLQNSGRGANSESTGQKPKTGRPPSVSSWAPSQPSGN